MAAVSLFHNDQHLFVRQTQTYVINHKQKTSLYGLFMLGYTRVTLK